MRNLESSYPALQNLPAQDKFLVHVLGGGYTPDEELSAQARLSAASLARLTEGIRLCNQLTEFSMVFSGPHRSASSSMASTMRDAAIELGIDSTRILLLEGPENTNAEAIAFRKKFGAVQNVILVTDAIHMPRAMAIFQREGIVARPAPTNFLVKQEAASVVTYWPSVQNLMLMDRAIHEIIGKFLT